MTAGFWLARSRARRLNAGIYADEAFKLHRRLCHVAQSNDLGTFVPLTGRTSTRRIRMPGSLGCRAFYCLQLAGQ
jgi:hypothetical protein